MWRIFPLDIFSPHLSCGEIFHLTDLSPHLSCGEIFHLTTCHGENFSTWTIFSPQTPSVVSVTNIRYADLFSWNKYVNLFSVMVINAILSAICATNSRCFVARSFLSKIYALLSVNFQDLKYASVKKMTNIRYENASGILAWRVKGEIRLLHSPQMFKSKYLTCASNSNKQQWKIPELARVIDLPHLLSQGSTEPKLCPWVFRL